MVRIYGSYAESEHNLPQLSDLIAKVNKLAVDNTESGKHNGDIESCDAICAEFDKVCVNSIMIGSPWRCTFGYLY